jgi:hypothetical protein
MLRKREKQQMVGIRKMTWEINSIENRIMETGFDWKYHNKFGVGAIWIQRSSAN